MIFNPNLTAGAKMVTGTINISYVGNNAIYPNFLYVDDNGWHNIDRGQVTISVPENSFLVLSARGTLHIRVHESFSGGVSRVFHDAYSELYVSVFYVTSDFTLSIT